MEKARGSLVSDSPRDGSALCTGARCWHFRGRTREIQKFLKLRLDKLLVDRGLAASRERAQALILAGKVLVNDQKVEKAGAQVDAECVIRLLGEDLKYVSRGGLKLERALDHWKIEVDGQRLVWTSARPPEDLPIACCSMGASVIAIDTGYGQMDFKLRQDPRVRLAGENQCALSDARDDGEAAIDFIAMDVSFISATLVLPAVIAAAFPEVAGRPPGATDRRAGEAAIRSGQGIVGKGGIVRDEAAQLAAVEKVKAAVKRLGAAQTDMIDSPILGAEGNREFLAVGGLLSSFVSLW